LYSPTLQICQKKVSVKELKTGQRLKVGLCGNDISSKVEGRSLMGNGIGSKVEGRSLLGNDIGLKVEGRSLMGNDIGSSLARSVIYVR
jgi:hypothetical protein